MSHYDSLSQWNKDLCIAPLLKDGSASSELSPIRERPATTYSFAMSSSGSTGTHNIRLTEQKAGQSDCSILNLNIPPVG